ncbi:hypothetical protein [Dactylosporangium sp. NPDC050588]|uniref:hypothetical protein n=1 Tax=Dactylosporangium sp. NPDC050588 TaxID=3157211 RepID=UPI0033E52869
MTDFFDVPVGDYGHEGAGGEMAHDYGHGDVHDGAPHRYSEPPEPDNLLYDSDGDGEMDQVVIGHGWHETVYEDLDHDGDVDRTYTRDAPSGVNQPRRS